MFGSVRASIDEWGQTRERSRCGMSQERKQLSWFQFSIRRLVFAAVLLSLSLGVWRNWEYLPGTYYEDASGHPHGSGKRFYYYNSGQLRLVESYSAGALTCQTWYAPNGTLIASSKFSKKDGGIGYSLRQDGSIRTRVPFYYSAVRREYVAHGTAFVYASDGTVAQTIEFRDGVAITDDLTSPPAADK